MTNKKLRFGMTRLERHAEEHRDEATMFGQLQSRHRAGLNMDLSPTAQDDEQKTAVRDDTSRTSC